MDFTQTLDNIDTAEDESFLTKTKVICPIFFIHNFCLWITQSFLYKMGGFACENKTEPVDIL